MIEAQPIECLDLCELVPSWSSVDEAEEQVRILWECVGRRRRLPALPARVYIGSSFCPNILLAADLRHVESLAGWCAQAGIPVTLTVPLATEGQLEDVTRRVRDILDVAAGVVDEVTLNDYGACAYWGEHLSEEPDVCMNLGRLLSKDLRDPRDAEYSELAWTPTLLQRGWQGYTNLDRLLQTWPIGGIELDPTHAVLDLSALPEAVVPAVHGPLCYMSTGRICELAGIGREAGEKFRPNAACALQCRSTAVRYRGASGVEFLKLGRSVYFEAPAVEVRGVASYRLVLAPLEEVLG